MGHGVGALKKRGGGGELKPSYELWLNLLNLPHIFTQVLIAEYFEEGGFAELKN